MKKDIILLGMLVFVPIAFVAEWLELHPVLVFLLSGLAIIPLAAQIANSTESIAAVVGPSLGGLLNATFGNATEMIIAIVALRAGLVDVVKASITGRVSASQTLLTQQFWGSSKTRRSSKVLHWGDEWD